MIIFIGEITLPKETNGSITPESSIRPNSRTSITDSSHSRRIRPPTIQKAIMSREIPLHIADDPSEETTSQNADTTQPTKADSFPSSPYYKQSQLLACLDDLSLQRVDNLQQMSIVQLIEIQGCILGISADGALILWDLREVKKTQGTYIFKDNISLLPSKCFVQIDAHSLEGIKQYQDTLVMYNPDTIYIATLQHIFQSLREERVKGITSIKVAAHLEKKELINSLAICSENLLLVGTNKGNVYSFDYLQNAVQHRVSVASQSKPESQLTIFATTQRQVQEVNSIALYGELALVGSSNGKAYSLRVDTLEKIFELTANCKQQLQSINKIVFSKDQEKVYLLHQSYITEWSLKLSSCLSYIDYQQPKDLLAKNDRIMIVGNHSKLLWYDTSLKTYDLSMRSANGIRELSNELTAVWGSDCTVDLLTGGMRMMTLFHRK